MVGIKIVAFDNYRPDRENCNNEFMTYSDLAVQAAQKVLSKTNTSPKEIDFLISITETSDYMAPQAGCLIRERLNLEKAVVLNLNDGLGGFNLGISVAAQFLCDSNCTKVLVVTGEALGEFTVEKHWTAEYFFDSAAAILIERDPSEKSGILAEKFQSEGRYYDYLQVRAGGSKCPVTLEGISRNEHRLKQYAYYDVNTLITNAFMRTLGYCLTYSKLNLDQIDYFIPSNFCPDAFGCQVQALARQTDVVGRIGQPDSRFSSAADIVDQLIQALNSSKLCAGKKVFIFSLSLGFQWSGVLLCL